MKIDKKENSIRVNIFEPTNWELTELLKIGVMSRSIVNPPRRYRHIILAP
jgi:hypothetical protein